MKYAGIAFLLSITLIAAISGGTAALDPELSVEHTHEAHSTTIADVVFDSDHNVVWSIDQNGTFVGYDVTNESVIMTDKVGAADTANSLAIGDGVVYIGDGDTLWEYNVTTESRRVLNDSLPAHAGAMAYDSERDVVWLTGFKTVAGYHATNGSLYLRYQEHTEGTSDISVQGKYVVTATTWSDEVIVYNIETQSVAYEPQLPNDTKQTGAVHLTEENQLIVGSSGDEGSRVQLFDLESETMQTSYSGQFFGISSVEYDEENDVIISTAFDNTVKFYDTETESIISTYSHDDTIYTADLDTRNDILWFGDGQDGPGSIIGLSVADTQTPSPTMSPTRSPTPTPTATQPENSQASPTDSPAPTTTESPLAGESPTQTTGPTENEKGTPESPSGDGGGFNLLIGIAAGFVFLAGVGYLLLTQYRGSE